jgi:nucleoside-diphosphate-sugar epimerase
MTKILITGSNSFVGKSIIEYSKNRDISEISLIDNKPEEINFKDIEIVIHLAAIVHQYKKTPENEYYQVNRDLTLRVAECSKKGGVKQFIFLSTFKVYGDIIPPDMILNENSPCFPADAYGKSKREAELGLIKLEESSFIVSIIRTPLVYGIGVKANMLSLLNLVYRFPILPFAEMNNSRCYTYTENLVGFIDRIIEIKASGIFIAMDQKPLSTTKLVEYISKYFDKKIYLFRMPMILINIIAHFYPGIANSLYGSFESDNRKTLERLMFKSPYSSEEGVKKMVLAYKKSKKNRSNKEFNM